MSPAASPIVVGNALAALATLDPVEGIPDRPVDRGCRLTSGALRALVGAEPWASRVREHVLVASAPAGMPAGASARPASLRPIDAVVAVPARDESARIARCLDACADSIDESGRAVELLVLVNGSTDDTCARALAWSARRRRPLTLVDVAFLPGWAHAGAARGLALALAALDVPPATALLTTDADTVPALDWVRRNLEHLDAGVALVCGAIGVDPGEVARLPPASSDCADVAERYQRATREIESHLDPDPWNRWPHHGTSGGASLAIRRTTLEAVGGVPPIPCGEGRALAARVRGAGARVRYADDVVVTASCRLYGRAPGGMADTIRRRLFEVDPLCDAEFRTARRVADDARLAAALRRCWSRRDARVPLLLAHGLPSDRAAAIAGIDDVSDALQACRASGSAARLRVSTLRAELPVLLALLARAREEASTCRA